jgi:hypothetical protein
MLKCKGHHLVYIQVMKIPIEVTRRELGTLLAKVKAQAGHESWRKKVTGTTEESHSSSYRSELCVLCTSVTAEAVYIEVIEVLDGCYGDYQLAVVYRSQPISESLQEPATAIQQLAPHAFVGLP